MDNHEIKPLVTVIVPVYKVEDYLERCLDSICRQSLSDIEIILVNDASPDKCGDICEKYALEDRRIKVYHHTENKGLSAARNLGIKNATGKYLMFVDSDDWVHEDFCKAAYQCAEQHQADLVMFNYVRVKHGEMVDGNLPKVFKSFSEGAKAKEESLNIMLADGGNAAWNKLYRKELFDDIIYPEGFLYEDTGATYKLVFTANHFYFLDKILYYQYIRPGSITTSRLTLKVLSDRAILNTQRYRDLTAWGFHSEMLEYRYLNFALWYCIHQKRDLSNPEYVYLAHSLQSCSVIPRTFSVQKKCFIYLFKYCPWLFELMFKIKGEKIL